MSENREIRRDELDKIRALDDFDLIMLISEVHDLGWDQARRLLKLIPPGAGPKTPTARARP